MKKLLLAVLSLALVPVFAEDAPAAKPAQAKTKATPKAAAKKAAPKAPEFVAYDAGAWKALDNRKGHLLGYKITEADLFKQPILVVKCDPAIEVSGKAREENADGKYIYNLIGWGTTVMPRYQVVNVPSRELTSDETADFAKLAGKSAGIPGFPWYKDFGLEKEPENPKGEYPFYYVVGIDGKVWYAGPKGVKAQRILNEQFRKGGTPDPMLGFYKPTVHTAIAETLKFGESTQKAVQKLTPLAAAKAESDSKADAEAILNEIGQSQTYWMKQVSSMLGNNPPMAFILVQQAAKTFPRDKEYKALLTKIKTSQPQQALKTFTDIVQIQDKVKTATEKGVELKKSDVKKWYAQVCAAEKKVNAAKKSFGDKLPRAFFCLEELVLSVKSELEAAGAAEK